MARSSRIAVLPEKVARLARVAVVRVGNAGTPHHGHIRSAGREDPFGSSQTAVEIPVVGAGGNRAGNEPDLDEPLALPKRILLAFHRQPLLGVVQMPRESQDLGRGLIDEPVQLADLPRLEVPPDREGQTTVLRRKRREVH